MDVSNTLLELTLLFVSSARLAARSSRSRRAFAFIWACMLKLDGCLVCWILPLERIAEPLTHASFLATRYPVSVRLPVVLLLTRPPALPAVAGALSLEMVFVTLVILLAAFVAFEIEPKSHGCLSLLVVMGTPVAPAVLIITVAGLFPSAGGTNLIFISESAKFSKLFSAISDWQQYRRSSRTDCILRRSTISNGSCWASLCSSSSNAVCLSTKEIIRATSYVLDLSQSAINRPVQYVVGSARYTCTMISPLKIRLVDV